MTSESFFIGITILLLLATLWFLIEEVWDLALFSRKSTEKEVTNLSTIRALSLFHHHGEITAIDVRPKESFQKDHLPRAVSAPFIDDRLDPKRLATLDREKPILIYCDGGYRSRRATPAFIEAGFTRVFHLNRGVMMWRLFGGPTESDEDSSS